MLRRYLLLMTGLLWAAVALIGVVALVALVVSLAVARRLRELQQRFGPIESFDDLPAPGTAVPDFVATTVDGGTVSAADLAGPDVVVLFVDGSCATCFDIVTELRARPAPTSEATRPIAVVIGQPDERGALVAELTPLARVVEESSYVGLPARFGVRGFPTALVAGGGVVRAASHRLDQIDLGISA